LVTLGPPEEPAGFDLGEGDAGPAHRGEPLAVRGEREAIHRPARDADFAEALARGGVPEDDGPVVRFAVPVGCVVEVSGDRGRRGDATAGRGQSGTPDARPVIEAVVADPGDSSRR